MYIVTTLVGVGLSRPGYPPAFHDPIGKRPLQSQIKSFRSGSLKAFDWLENSNEPITTPTEPELTLDGP